MQPLGFPIQYSGHLGFPIQCSGLLGYMVVISLVMHLTSGSVLQGLVVLNKVEVVKISFNRSASWLRGGAPSHNVFAICTQDSTTSLRPYCLICYTIMTSAYCHYAVLHPQFEPSARSAQFSNGATWLPNLYSIGINLTVSYLRQPPLCKNPGKHCLEDQHNFDGGHRDWLRLITRPGSALELLFRPCTVVPHVLPYRSMDMTDVEDIACEQDELADLVDFEATPEEVLSRIEHCISAFLAELSYGRLQSIQTVSESVSKPNLIKLGLSRAKAKLAHLQVSRVSSNAYLASANDGIRLQQAVQTRSLVQRQGESAFHFVRIFKVLEVVHELLRYLLCNSKPVFYSGL